MSKFVGHDPKPKTVKATEEFENKVIIRRNNRSLLPGYLQTLRMMSGRWQ